MKQGAYVLTPGWLEGWQTHLEETGDLIRSPEKSFFMNLPASSFCWIPASIRGVRALLQEMGDYLDLPLKSCRSEQTIYSLYLVEWYPNGSKRLRPHAE